MDLTARTIPTVHGTGSVRTLTADECTAKADEIQADLDGMAWVSPEWRRSTRREINAWRRLAAERAA